MANKNLNEDMPWAQWGDGRTGPVKKSAKERKRDRARKVKAAELGVEPAFVAARDFARGKKQSHFKSVPAKPVKGKKSDVKRTVKLYKHMLTPKKTMNIVESNKSQAKKLQYEIAELKATLRSPGDRADMSDDERDEMRIEIRELQKKLKRLNEKRSYLGEILTELHNCVRHEQEEMPLVWSKDVQQRLTDTDHWNRAQRAKSHVADMDFQDAEDQDIIVPYNDNYGYDVPTPGSSDFNPEFGAEDETLGDVGDNEEVGGLGGFASAPWGDYGDEDEFDADDEMYSDTEETAMWADEEQEEHGPQCACKHCYKRSMPMRRRLRNNPPEEQQELDPEDDESFAAVGRREGEQDMAADYEQDMFNLRRGRVSADDPANDNYRGFGGSDAGDVDKYPSDPDEDLESSFYPDRPRRSRFIPPKDPDSDPFDDADEQDDEFGDRMVDVGDEDDLEDSPNVWDRFDRNEMRDSYFDGDRNRGEWYDEPRFRDEEEEMPRFKDFYRLGDDEQDDEVPFRAKKNFGDDVDLRGRQKIRKSRRRDDYEEQQEEAPTGMASQGGPQGGASQQNQMSQSRQDNPDESTPTNMAVDQQYGPDDPNEKGEDFADATGTGQQQEWEDPDYQGVIRVVPNAHLVHKRQQEDGTFNELWLYNLGHDFKRELKVRRAILAGTDIQPNKVRSPDKKQSYELWTAGNGQILHIKGLPN